MQEDVVVAVPVRLISMPKDQYSQAWFVWFLVTFGGFAALESYAVQQNVHERTLSFHTRRIFGIHPKRRWTPFGQAAFILCIGSFCGWFTHHIALKPFERSAE